ncbi:hypothetical protein NJO91_09875 [Streptomyces microflavus]|uniref:hypothetical protein n=1 Tax=Streptomyces microflavus TaxID=1919 RepID=UPI0029B0D8E1|nr:hypothetical protein [Streptomyces microflavus]MDX2403434.1 hypothetical protein [Streptomyces microflavus]
MIREQWDGGEWEEHCRRLLAMRYDSKIQFIPARDGGDGGLEAFRLDGVAYQCYAPEEAFSVDSQTKSQKKKIYTDLKKICDDVPGTRRLLGEIRLHTWILMTPQFDSRTLVEYARKKSHEILNLTPAPAWRADTFEILIITDEEFAAERTRLFGEVDARLNIDIPRVDDSYFASAAGTEIGERIDAKLSIDQVMASDPEFLAECRNEMIAVFFRGQGQMELLQRDYPTLHQAVDRRLKNVLSTLTMTVAGIREPGFEVMATLVRKLTDGLQTDAPGLSSVLCEQIAWYAVADWLIRCPLKFRRVA